MAGIAGQVVFTCRTFPAVGSKLLIALGLAGVIWLMTPTSAMAQQTGNFCMTDLGGSSCSASDANVNRFAVVSMTDSCVNTTGDTGTAVFEIELLSNQPDRYDFGYTVDLSGSPTGAYDGNACYHDYLPAPLSTTALPPGPPYLDDHNGGGTNVCGDGGGGNSAWRRTLQPITFVCKDNDNDGRYDIQVCNSWTVSKSRTCASVADAVPDPGSKCNCATFNILGPLAVGVTGFRAEAAGGAGRQNLGIALMFGAAVTGLGMMRARRRKPAF